MDAEQTANFPAVRGKSGKNRISALRFAKNTCFISYLLRLLGRFVDTP